MERVVKRKKTGKFLSPHLRDGRPHCKKPCLILEKSPYTSTPEKKHPLKS